MTVLSEAWAYRGLVGNLAQREMKARYKRSVLGWAWSLINPATTILIYSFVFSTLLKAQAPLAGNGHTKNFALFLFCGLVVWNFWVGVITGSMGSLLGVGALLRRVYFPPEIPVISNIVVAMTQTAIEAGILVLIMIVIGNTSWTFVLVPYVLVMLGLFSLGIGLLLSLANVYLRDVGYLVGVVMNMLFYATPIVYPFTLVDQNAPGAIRTLVVLNPLTQFVGAMRDVTYSLQMPSAARLMGITAAGVVSIVAGWLLFRRFGMDVSEEL